MDIGLTGYSGHSCKTYTHAAGRICMYCQHSLKEPPPDYITSKYIDWSLFPQGFLNHPIHLQHNHKTKMTEGAVHNYCNAVMWQYERR